MVYIDFNQNGSFDDVGESFYIGRLGAATPFNAFTVSNTITVPANAANGSTRMRVLKNTNLAAYSDPNAAVSINAACDSGLRAGQTEDYTVNIAGNTAGFPAPYCGTDKVTSLTVSEISGVEFAGITNNSALDGNSDVLENFTAVKFNGNRGNAYPITVTEVPRDSLPYLPMLILILTTIMYLILMKYLISDIWTIPIRCLIPNQERYPGLSLFL